MRYVFFLWLSRNASWRRDWATITLCNVCPSLITVPSIRKHVCHAAFRNIYGFTSPQKIAAGGVYDFPRKFTTRRFRSSVCIWCASYGCLYCIKKIYHTWSGYQNAIHDLSVHWVYNRWKILCTHPSNIRQNGGLHIRIPEEQMPGVCECGSSRG